MRCNPCSDLDEWNKIIIAHDIAIIIATGTTAAAAAAA
jgi:hypothetical protein